MRAAGHRVTLICSPDKQVVKFASREGVDYLSVSIAREIDVISDIKSLIKVFMHLRQIKPDCVNASTPKAALVGIIASAILRIPVRIYHLRGLRLETETGLKRHLLRSFELVTARLSTHILANSESLRDLYIDSGLAKKSKCVVLGTGSGNGVDVDRYYVPTDVEKRERKTELGLSPDSIVVGFVGRLVTDKGIDQLVDAYESLNQGKCQLVLVGPYEDGDPLSASVRARIESNPNICCTGLIIDTVPATQAMDLLVFLSRREGFPNVVIECAACGVPALARQATGTVDSIVDGETGWLLQDESFDGLTSKLNALVNDLPALKAAGQAARNHVVSNWSDHEVWKRLGSFYSSLERAG